MKQLHTYITCLLYLLFCDTIIGEAQTLERLQNLSLDNFAKLTEQNGLSSNYIQAINQDSDGYIWVATQFGLNKYDEKKISSYYYGDSQIKLPSNNIRFIINAGKNLLGIGTTKGFVLLNTKTYSSQLFAITDTTAFQVYINSNSDACVIDSNRIAITTSTGFYVYNMQGKLVFRYDGYKLGDEKNNTMRYAMSIFKLSRYEFLISTDRNDMAYYNSFTNFYKHFSKDSIKRVPLLYKLKNNFLSRSSIRDDELLCMYFEKDSIMYYNHAKNLFAVSAVPIGTKSTFPWYAKIKALSDSLFLINSRTGFYPLYVNRVTGNTTFGGLKILKEIACNTFFVDRNKRLWLGTETGLYMQKLKKVSIQKVYTNAGGNNTQSSNAAICRYKNKYYLGAYAKYDSSLIIMDANTLKIEKKIAFANGLENEYREILSIQQYHKDTLWVSTLKGILWFDVNSYKYGKVIFPTAHNKYQKYEWPVLYPMDKHGNAWLLYLMQGCIAKYCIATRKYTFYTSATKPSLPFIKVKDINYDSDGNAWVLGHGMARYNYATNTFDKYRTIYGGPNKYNDNITASVADNSGHIWMQTADNNLLQYNIKHDTFMDCNTSKEIPIGFVNAFSSAINDYMYMLHFNKLIKVHLPTFNSQVFTQSDGLPDDKIVEESKIYFDSIANKFIGLYEHHLAFFSETVGVNDSSNFKVHFSSIDYGSKKIAINGVDEITLQANVHQATLHFTVIDFENPDDYKFYYSINKSNYIAVKYERVIQLNNLSSGSYFVTLKAISKSGKIVLKNILVSIETPFWRTWLFKLLMLVSAILIVYKLVVLRISNIKRKAVIEHQLTEFEMKALHTQMNPHFIFNSLGTIKSMILDNQNEKANKYLGTFAKMIRLTLNHSTKAFISLQQNNEYIKYYLEIENLRFNNAFTYEITVDKNLNEAEVNIPPMMIQPLVENAIWHGLLNKVGDKKLVINFYLENNMLVCSVVDNGLGIDVHAANIKQSSVGLSNIKERLALLNEKYNSTCQLILQNKAGLLPAETGTIATITLPYIT
jgi:ligand-binding sensor domain-containing protein